MERAWKARASMLEALAERDEAFMDTYLAVPEGDKMRDMDVLPLEVRRIREGIYIHPCWRGMYRPIIDVLTCLVHCLVSSLLCP